MAALLFDVFIQILLTDAMLAIGSIGMVFTYIWVTTGSGFLALIGMTEIVLSLPVAWFFLRVIQVKYFAGLNMSSSSSRSTASRPPSALRVHRRSLRRLTRRSPSSSVVPSCSIAPTMRCLSSALCIKVAGSAPSGSQRACTCAPPRALSVRSPSLISQEAQRKLRLAKQKRKLRPAPYSQRAPKRAQSEAPKAGAAAAKLMRS